MEKYSNKDEEIKVLKKRIKELEKSEKKHEFHAKILSEINDAVIVTNNDAEFTISFWNKGAEKIYGWKEEEVLGKSSKILDTEFSHADKEKALEIIIEGGSFNGQVTQVRKDNTRFPVDTRLLSFKSNQNEISGWVAVNRDITELKQVEKELEYSKEHYSSLFNESPVPLWEEDFTELNKYLEVLKQNGIQDLRTFLSENPEELSICAQKIIIKSVNSATLKLHKAKSKEELLGNLNKIFTKKSFEVFLEEVIAISERQTEFESEGEVKTLTGDTKSVFLRLKIDYENPEFMRAILATTDITERIVAEEKLRESEEILNTFFEHSPVGFGILDKELRYVYVNEVLQKINGSSKEEHIGYTIEEVLPKVAPIIVPLLNQIFDTCQPLLNMELSGELPSKPDTIYHFIVSYFPLLVKDGKPQLIGIEVVDITDLKNTQRDLIESEFRFKSLFENAAVPIWLEDFSDVKKEFDILKSQGVNDFELYFNSNPDKVSYLSNLVKVIDVNQKSVNFYGAEDKESLIKNITDYFTSESFEIFKEELIALANGASSFEGEIPIRTPDGKNLTLIVSLAVPDAYKDSLEQILVSFLDITDRKKNDEKILDLLHDQEIILDNVPALIFFKDTTNNILRITQSVADLTGLPKDQIEGKPVAEIYPDMADKYYEDDLKVINSGIPERGIIEPIPTQDGTMWLLTDKIPYVEKNGNIAGIIVISTDITKFKNVETALRDSELRFRSLTEQSPISTALYTPTGKLTYGNPASKKLLGVTQDNIEKMYENYNIFNDKFLVESGVMHFIEKGFSGKFVEVPEINMELNTSNGDSTTVKRWLKSFIYPVKNDEGEILEIVLLHEDTTERKLALDALQESEERFRAIFEQASVGVAQVNTKTGEFKKINKRFAEIVGYTIEQMEKLSFQKITHPDDLNEDLKNLQLLLNGSIREFVQEKRYIHRDGSIVWVNLSVSAMWNIDEEPNYNIAIIEDITERRNAEESLKRIEWLLDKNISSDESNIHNMDNQYMPTYGDLLELNTSRVILDSVGQNILYEVAGDYLDLLDTSSAIYEKNGDYASGLFSSGWCQYLDQASFNICKTKDAKTALDSGKWLCHESCWKDASKVAMETKQPVDIECNGGIRLYAIPIEARGEIVGAINFGHGNPPIDDIKLKEIAEKYQVDFEELKKRANSYETRPPYIVELAKKRLHSSARLIGEIVERKAAENNLSKLNIQLNVKNVEQEQLLYATSHDLRSPLVNIHGFNKELKTSLEELTNLLSGADIPQSINGKVKSIINEDIPEALQYILTSTTKMDTLLHGLLTLSRLGRHKARMEKVEINKLMNDVKNNYKYEITEKQINIEISDLPDCTGDEVKINQLFSNLLENSIKYLDPTREGIIKISGEKTNEKSIYLVEDNGIGIPKNQQKKIFDIFYQYDTEKPGIGIGLTIVKQILDQHNGTIDLDSEYGKGTKIIITIPRF